MSSCFPLRECRDLEPFLTPGGTYTSVILRMHDLGVLIIPLEGTATRAPFIPVSHQPVLSKGPKQRTTSGYFSSGWLCVCVRICVCVCGCVCAFVCARAPGWSITTREVTDRPGCCGGNPLPAQSGAGASRHQAEKCPGEFIVLEPLYGLIKRVERSIIIDFLMNSLSLHGRNCGRNTE